LEIELAILAGLPPLSRSFAQESVIIGRSTEADLVLSHPEVSRRHCRIVAQEGVFLIEDLGSQRGTVVNGSAITGQSQLTPGDQITLGPVVIGFGKGPAGQAPPAGEVPVGEALGAPGTVVYSKQAVDRIPLTKRLVFGRSQEVDVQLNDPMVSRRHAVVEESADGFRVLDLYSRAGSFVNGRRFDEHQLIIGDQLQLGPFCFVFTGNELHRILRVSVGKVIANGLTRTAGGNVILQDVSFVAEPGQFIGILGPSGAGKSTLLGALSGLKPADSGKILINDTDFYGNLNQLRSMFGYVPQDDIVHGELTTVEALTFAARLRLPAGTPRPAIAALVQQTMGSLGLAERKDLRISLLSGGQRKRVSVGVELLRRPPLIFLDEPTSGLDPFSEFKLMELLRRLADTGCTVICTTHVMENVFLMDQIAVLLAGKLLFQGPPDAARARFGVSRLSALYDMLQTIDPKTVTSFSPPEITSPSGAPATEQRPPTIEQRRPFALPILLRRQLAIFKADTKNLLIALGQPLVIGLLVCWVTDKVPLIQFFAYIATLWFGCSNSAQEIVKEIAIFRRERLVGLSRTSYLTSKFIWMGTITSLQSLLLYACALITTRVPISAAPSEIVGLLFLGYAATGIGLAISCFARSALQAVMLVPLVLIPQILFSGFTVQTDEMDPFVLAVAQVMPSFAAERISDTSLLLNQKLTGETTTKYRLPYDNLNQFYRSLTHERLKTGQIYTTTRPLFVGYLSLILWSSVGFVLSYIGLVLKEKE
jgi:ABC-type multidrug transport system ATPase subunit/pSer/pThr/pTyr-binding forkhead associated (FHA) protein